MMRKKIFTLWSLLLLVLYSFMVHAQEESGLFRLSEWVNVIVDWSNAILGIVAIYFLWRTIAGTGGGTKAAEWGLSGAAGAGGWLKSKGAVPFTKEHREKYGDYKVSKRAFKLEMDGYIRDKNELALMESAQKRVDELSAKKSTLEKMPATTVDAREQFEKFEEEVKAARTAVKRETEGWHKMGRWYRRKWPRYIKQTDDVIKELEANREISAEKINKIKSLQNDVLVLHQDTQKNVQELDALMEGLEKAAAEAVAQWKSHKIFDPRIAKKALSSFDFRSAPQLAQKAVDLQKRTVEELRGLIAETGKTM